MMDICKRSAVYRRYFPMRKRVGVWALALALSTTVAAYHPDGLFTVARLKYEGNGDWYWDPLQIPNLLAALRERTGMPTLDDQVVVELSSPDLFQYPLLYMTGHGEDKHAWRLSAGDAQRLRRYLLAGGFLWCNDSYGLREHFQRAMELVFPDRPWDDNTGWVNINRDPSHPLFHMRYEFPRGLPKIHEHDGKPPEGWALHDADGRMMVLFTYECDIGDGIGDRNMPEYRNDTDELREQAMQMAINIVLFALSQ